MAGSDDKKQSPLSGEDAELWSRVAAQAEPLPALRRARHVEGRERGSRRERGERGRREADGSAVGRARRDHGNPGRVAAEGLREGVESGGVGCCGHHARSNTALARLFPRLAAIRLSGP